MIKNLRVLRQLPGQWFETLIWQPPKFHTYVYDYLHMPFNILWLLYVKSTWA